MAIQIFTLLVLFIVFLVVENRIYLYNTNDGADIEYYDCVLLQSLFYCRRPRESINLTRDDDVLSCEQNDGQLHRFSELRLNNVTVSTILHQWKSTLERVEQYSVFLRDPSEKDGLLCQCFQPGSFGKNCEYQLPVGETFEETLEWQLIMRKENPVQVQMHGDVVCYETLECHSGALCLDWREICDGIQNCLEGKDEENCDLLEMNRCDAEEEYRCENGMCIPQEFFLDGELDCLDWSDEMSFKESKSCPMQSVQTECDDHVCPPDHWSCGDGQCIYDGLNFLKWAYPSSCQSGRDQYFICEIHVGKLQWTMNNGRCFTASREMMHKESVVANRSEEEQCEFYLKCALSWGKEIGCSCRGGFECTDRLEESCLLSLIPYPFGAIVAPYLFFLFNGIRDSSDSSPNWILINGTMRCGDHQVTVTRMIPFDVDLNGRRMTEEHFCRSSQNATSVEMIEPNHQCHHWNESTDRCGEWNSCLSITRLNDGFKNCLNGSDEVEQTEMEVEKSCAEVRHHRFRCSREQPTCLSVIALGDQSLHCRNGFDELWFGTDRRLSSVNCNHQWKDECSLLRQYLEQSSIAVTNKERHSEIGIRFRSYCDTFWDLESRRDEDPLECHHSWICSEDQFTCRTGQCVERSWVGDDQWDCGDASDEYTWLNQMPGLVLGEASRQNWTNRTYFIPSTCPQTSPFLCLSAEATRQGFSCFNLNQIGDGRIDCAGGMDERNTLQHCSDQSSMLGHHFLCPSTNTCIPYLFHCSDGDGHRCPRRSDDQFWCDRQHQPTSGCFELNDFVCFDGQCVKGGRCNWYDECLFTEDEYMCDYQSSNRETFIPHREEKQTFQRMKEHSIELSRYPLDVNVTELDSDSISIVPPERDLHLNHSSISPYWCNRGLGVLSKTDSILVCFCPPHYYGDKCQFHQDRLSVLLHLDLSQSNDSAENDPRIVLQLLVLFLLNNETMMSEHFHLRLSSMVTMKKLQTHFVYPHSSSFREQRRERFFNRSDLLHRHPFSIRIELYRTRLAERPALINVWNDPIFFDHLPVYRFAKVLHLRESSLHRNPPSSQENDSEADPQCTNGYCSLGSVCQPNSSTLFRGELLPLCFCPLNRFGQRCSIEHSACLSSPCLNNGSCLPERQPDQFVCVCTDGFLGSRCQWTRPSIHLSLFTDLSYAAGVIQYFRIDLTSLDLILVDQYAYRTLPEQIQSDRQDRNTLPEIILVKLYSSDQNLSPDLYLLSVQVNVISLTGTTQISSINRCEHLRTFSNETSPIHYHRICIDDPIRLCFRDDVYLCICADNRTRVECFLYNDQLDRCSFCRAEGRCLRGDPHRSADFFCLCPRCHFGQQCQFNTKSFSFTLDQLFSPDLLSTRKRSTISLLLSFSLFIFFLSLAPNLFSFFTLRRRSCLRQGVGHYLLWMSVTNQLSLSLLTARLIHLTVIITLSRSSPLIDDLLCKLLGYFLTCLSRLSPWLSSFVALERVYSVLFFTRHWFKQPRIARSLIFLIVALILVSASYELVFVKSFTGVEDRSSAMCVIEYPSTWISIHQIVSVGHLLFPLLINLCSTLTIVGIVINNKINIRKAKLATTNETRLDRVTVLRSVFNESREMITRPAITLVPSIFSLFSLPFLIISFLLGCQNLDGNPLRYVLITLYFIPFIPQILMFYLYIYPSSFYWKQWQSTTIGRRLTGLRQHQSIINILFFPTIHEQKTQDLFSVPKKD